MALSIASIGECMIELSGKGGETWRMGFAGDTLNTLWAMRALLPPSARTDYVSAFGDDPFSVRQRAFMAEAGIGTADSPVIAGACPGIYAISLEGADRSFTYWRSEAAARKLASDPGALSRSLSGRTLAFLSGVTLAILDPAGRATLLAALAEAHAKGTRIAFDPNYRARLWPQTQAARDALAQIWPLVDIALPTFPDEETLFGDASPAATATRLRQAGIAEIVVKNGAEPALVDAGGETAEVPAVAVQVVDATGAGDSFNGAYLAARLLGEPPVAAAARAHRVAAAVVGIHGALAPHERLRAAFNG